MKKKSPTADRQLYQLSLFNTSRGFRTEMRTSHHSQRPL